MKAKPQLLWASWTSLNTGITGFSSDWESDEPPRLVWGNDHLPIPRLERSSEQGFAMHSGYYGENGGITFVFLADNLPSGLSPADAEVYVVGSFNDWAESIGDSTWKLQPDKMNGHLCFRKNFSKASFKNGSTFNFKFVLGTGEWMDVRPDAPNIARDSAGNFNYSLSLDRTGRHVFYFKTPLPLHLSEGRELIFKRGKQVDRLEINAGVFLKKMETPSALGVQVKDNKTRFRLFAPRARRVDLYLCDDAKAFHPEFADKLPKPIQLHTVGRKTLWEIELDGDYHGWYYGYKIDGDNSTGFSHFDPSFMVLDPWAKAVVGPLGPGIVLSDEFFAENRPNPSFVTPAWHDLVVLETHLRDLLAKAPIELSAEDRQGYRGLKALIESPHFYPEALGVNAIELQPIHVFDTQNPEEYAWGYMPNNYFSPATQYASDPLSASMVKEFQEVVEALHQRGFAVILDVVYNHVGEPNFLQFIDKEYFFILTKDGYYDNATGCGNTLDTQAPMVRRLIRDSLLHWITEFGIDGFRFDLGEIIGVDAFRWLEKELKAVKPDVILLAEPWSFRGHIAKSLKETGIASWNDGYREYVREYLTGKADARGLEHFSRGSAPDWSRFPAQTVNYVESHDDRCWIDKITENADFNGWHPTATDRRRSHLMIGILMMSAGIPMVSSGMDFLKSKGGVNNTYLRGDLNALNYDREEEFPASVDYMRAWIHFRSSSLGRLLRLDGFPGPDYFRSRRRGNTFIQVWNADRSLGHQQLLLAIQPDNARVKIKCPLDGGSPWVQIADSERFDLHGLKSRTYSWDGIMIELPPLSLGLWRR